MTQNQAIVKIIQKYRGNGTLYLISLTLDLQRLGPENTVALNRIRRSLIRRGLNQKTATAFCFPPAKYTH